MMPQHHSTQRRLNVQTYDPIWEKIRFEAEEITRSEPALASFVLANVLNHAASRRRDLPPSGSAPGP